MSSSPSVPAPATVAASAPIPKSDPRRDQVIKDNTEKSEFLAAIDSYAPTLPLECVEYYLKKAGMTSDDPRVTELIALSADRFLAKIIEETKQNSKLKLVNLNKKVASGQKRKPSDALVLEISDLSRTLAGKRIHLRRRIHEAK